MKELLTAIKSQLQTDLTYVRTSDVFVTEDENLIPEAVKFPAIGLKDGPVARIKRPGGCLEITQTVKIIVLTQLGKSEATIMGDTATGKKGVLDIADDIHTSLDANLLSISGMSEAFCSLEGESELVADEAEAIQRKISTYEYLKEA